jgi:hypothetical protein
MLMLVVVPEKMRKTIAILCMAAFVGCSTAPQTPVSPIIGKWVFGEDLDEYAGVNVYEFSASGKIILYDYPAGWKAGDTIGGVVVGQWEPAEMAHREGPTIRLKFKGWSNWGEDVLTKDNWLKPISGYKRRNIKLIPVAIDGGVPHGEGIDDKLAQPATPPYSEPATRSPQR